MIRMPLVPWKLEHLVSLRRSQRPSIPLTSYTSQHSSSY